MTILLAAFPPSSHPTEAFHIFVTQGIPRLWKLSLYSPSLSEALAE